jgi:tRNA nucleotidyltransferase (CCA-adding enzyme)
MSLETAGPAPLDPAGSGRDMSAEVAALGLEPLIEAAGETPLYLVGGAVRDLLLGRDLGDVDVAVEGDAIALARRLAEAGAAAGAPGEGGSASPAREHERFGTARVELGGREVDLAATRSETYPRPGALPEVGPAAIDADLDRRDFTVNAIAVPLAGPVRLVDPHGGREDVERGLLRVLHEGSFRDDPTRALRAARYAARFGFELEPETERLLRETDLATVSAERVEAELLRLAAEDGWRRGFELLVGWGLLRLGEPGVQGGGASAGERAEEALKRMEAVRETLARPPWAGSVAAPAAMLVAGGLAAGLYAAPPEPLREAGLLAEPAAEPADAGAASDAGAEALPPSRLAAAARDASPLVLVLARALGGEWLDTYMDEWRHVGLEIDGEDLIAAGIPQGPAVGRGLAAALAARLDAGATHRDDQLRIALDAARG